MKLAFISNKNKLSGKLTKFFTGTFCYHVAFVDLKTGRMYDMNLLRRKRLWPYYDSEEIRLVECPVDVPAEYLEAKLLTDENHYGFFDYCLFALRPLFHLFGKSTRNAGGVICSEMVYEDLKANGWQRRFDEVPSPADLEREILNLGNNP